MADERMKTWIKPQGSNGTEGGGLAAIEEMGTGQAEYRRKFVCSTSNRCGQMRYISGCEFSIKERCDFLLEKGPRRKLV